MKKLKTRKKDESYLVFIPRNYSTKISNKNNSKIKLKNALFLSIHTTKTDYTFHDNRDGNQT